MTSSITPKRRKELAEAHSLSEQYLYQCLTGRREMDPGEARRLEEATEGELHRRDLCQKTHARIWPELAEAAEAAKDGV